MRARVESGEWTLEEGLVSTLQFLAGEVGIDVINPSGPEIENLSGSSAARAARAYLASGPDASARAEVQRLLDLIFPEDEQLEQYSRPYQAGLLPADVVLASFSSDSVACRTLWAEGFPAGDGITCFEERTVEAGGATYKIYFPADWSAGDPRRELFDWTAQAVQDSLAAYERFGTMPSGTIVFTLLRDREHPGTEAAAYTGVHGGRCRIAILPPLTGAQEDYYKQVVAHELFHCFQDRNFWDQTGPAAADWWVESTAEYFSNVVYPTTNAEKTYWNQFDTQSIGLPLLDMDYANEVFFQYLAGRIDDAGILDLMENMPASEGRGAQLNRLAAYPDIEALFHDFAQAYLDQKIADTGGGMLDIEPGVDQVRAFSESRTEAIPIRSFLVARGVFVFPQGKRQALTEEIPDGMLSSAEPRGIRDSWNTLPGEIAAACDELVYIYAATTTEQSDESTEIRISSVTEDFDGICDPCVVGNWQLDTMSQWEAFSAVMSDSPVDLTLESISGGVTANFTPDGKMAINLTQFNIKFSQDMPGVHAEGFLEFDGLHYSDWFTDVASGTLFSMNPTSAPGYTGQVTITVGAVTRTESPTIQSFWSGLSLYQCSEDVLLTDSFTPSGVNGRYVTWYRLP
jgi:hypothetical protein